VSAPFLLPRAGDQHQDERCGRHQRADRGDGRINLVAQCGCGAWGSVFVDPPRRSAPASMMSKAL
jgi:hypothetical protein